MLPQLSVLIILLSFLSCSKERFDYSKIEAFDDLHKSISRYSASIDSRNINWDSLGVVYRSRISEDLTEQEYFEQISELLQEFRDPHIWLLTPFDSMYSINHLDYKKNYDETITNSYIINLEEHSLQIKSGFVSDSIGYLFCAGFKGNVMVNNDIYTSILDKFSNTKGLIIDLRVNDGGSVYNAQNLLNKLSNEELLWHTTQNKTITGFDEKYNWYINPDINTYYAQSIVVLNGRFTISAGERFAIGSRLINNMTILGATTANTQGSVMGREMLNGWKYTLTFEKCLDPDGVNYGGIGIPPDCHINAQQAILDNRDYILEKAIDLLK